MVDQTFHAAERLGAGEQLRALHRAPRRLRPTLHIDADHAAEAAHLALCQLMLRVRGKARVDDLVHRRMLLKPLRQLQRVLAMRAHPQMQRLEATLREETVERPLHTADGVLQEGHLFGQFRIVTHHHHTTDDVRMTVEVLGG